MKALSASYIRTKGFLSAGNAAEASAEFSGKFHIEVKRIYSEAACTAPARFVKAKSWGAWLRRFYALSVKAKKALSKAARGGEAVGAGKEALKEAMKTLGPLRKCFHDLHSETKVLKVNDHIYRFHCEVMKDDAPALEDLKKMRAELDKAEPSMAAKSDPKKYHQAKNEWSSTVDSVFADGKVMPAEVERLRKATQKFYRMYGEPFE